MSYNYTEDQAIVELNSAEIDEVAGGPAWFVWGAVVVGSAAVGAIGGWLARGDAPETEVNVTFEAGSCTGGTCAGVANTCPAPGGH